MLKSLKRLFNSRSGNFGLITAVVLVPVIGGAGCALDYSRSYNVHSKLMAAADAAALGAISERSKGYAAALAMQTDGTVPIAEEDGKKLFLAQAGIAEWLSTDNITMAVTKKGDNLTATATFNTSVPTIFMQLLGQHSVSVSGQATAVYEAETSNSFADFYMLLDNTPSMGIGATQSDIDKLVAATANAADGAGRNCAFACHMVWSNSGVEQADSTYLLARKAGVMLRIDVLGAAVQALIADASTIQGARNLFRFAAYNFGNRGLEPGYQIGKLTGLTGDLPSVKKAAAGLELMTTDHHNYNEDALTSFDTALTKIGAEIKTNGGTGNSTSDRQQIVFFVTDGVGDSIKPSGCTGLYSGSQGRCFEPIDLKYCDALKARNIKIAILYTTYSPLKDHLWDAYLAQFSTQIGPRLQQCASADLYFEAGPADNMYALMKKLFVKASSASRLRLSS
jgi:Flp pilus assembly protein TadG